MKTSHDMIIIGGGSGGLTLASGAAQLGLKVLLFEKSRMGGDCLHYGCVPSKTLLKSASLYHGLGRMADFGLPEVKRKSVDFRKIVERIDRVIEGISHHDSVERFESLGVDVIQGAPHFVSTHELQWEQQLFSSKKIVIATGSSPRIPPIEGLDTIPYITSREIFSLEHLPEHLITFGGGPVGVELSQAMARLGARVTILNKHEHILPREDQDMAQLIEHRLRSEGVEIENNVEILKAEHHGRDVRVQCRRGGEEILFNGSDILVSTGRCGNSGALGLEKIGVETHLSFVEVNNKLETSVKHIHAIGDINGQFLFTHAAGAEGSFLVKKLALGIPCKFSWNHVPRVTYSDPELASIGYNEKMAKEEGIAYRVILQKVDGIDRAQAEGETDGMMKILIDRRERVIGTQIAAFHGGDIILPSLYAVTKKYRLMELMSPIYPYPTLGEIQKRAAGLWYAPKIFNKKVRKILKWLYGYRG